MVELEQESKADGSTVQAINHFIVTFLYRYISQILAMKTATKYLFIYILLW